MFTQNTEFEARECCICMELLLCTNNYVKTKCGHEFHCSCLMKNTSHNGYGCPYCRTVLAEEVLEDSDTEDEDERDEETDDEEEYVIQEEESLLGLRLFTNRLDEEIDDDDNAMELNRLANDNSNNYYNDRNKKNEKLRTMYLKQREKYLLENLQKHNIGVKELISWIQLDEDTKSQDDGNELFNAYMDSSELNEYNWDTSKKIDGLIKSITTKFISLNPPPVLDTIFNDV